VTFTVEVDETEREWLREGLCLRVHQEGERHDVLLRRGLNTQATDASRRQNHMRALYERIFDVPIRRRNSSS
jgi:hypothetical protein